MEPTRKIWINVLIIIAILLIGVSITSVFIKKSEEPAVNNPPQIQQPVKQEVIATSTVDTSTTTNIEVATTTSTTTPISTSTSTSKSTSIEPIKGFIAKSWTWTKTTTGSKVATPKKVNAFIVMFNQDLSLKGTTDCNSFFGSYKLASSTKISFGPLGVTKMFCEGSEETDFMKSLSDVTNYSIDKSNNLILTTASGTTMMFK